MKVRITKVLLPILILAAAAASVGLMMANRITPERLETGERAVPVEVMELARTTEKVVVQAQGTVTATQQVRVRPEVAGRVVELSPSLVPGGRFSRGETILVIDNRDYRAQLAAQQEAVARARLILRQERAQQALAREEWEMLEDSVSASQADRELALRIPQIEQAEAAIAAAEGALAKAELDLERCTVRAPFNSVVISEQVDLGQLVNPVSEIATLVGTDAYWVQVSLPVEELEWIEIPDHGGQSGAPATVIHRAGAVEIRREGRVERLLGDVDPAGRLARLLIVIDDPLNLEGGHAGAELPLLIGSYVAVEIHGRTLENAIVIPRRALREIDGDGDGGAREGLWLMDGDDRLALRRAEVLWRSRETVILTDGIVEGERLVLSNIATPIEGMKLTIAGASSGPAGELDGDR